MHKLPFAIILLLLALSVTAQSPHGKAFKAECANCHTSGSWKEMNVKLLFDHDTTGFTLIGQHKQISCKACHQSLDFTIKKHLCVECHSDVHSGTLGKDCERCHTPNSWIINNISGLHQQSRFPLLGKHLTTNCVGCHKSSANFKYENLSIECNNCHQVQYSAAPLHTKMGYPTDCTKCHNLTNWLSTTFSHSNTNFPLTGLHIPVACDKCHTTSLAGTPTDCNSCHQAQYNTAPNHASLGYPTDCTKCHTTTNWLSISFNHSATNYPLTGLHTAVACNKCHTTSLVGTPTDCNSCHLTNFNSAKLPDHVAAGIPQDCATCHTPAGWKPSAFNHAATGFALTGTHQTIQCSDCHKGSLTGSNPACISCHQVQFNNAPGHTGSGYSTDCTKCHTTTNWLFNHSTTNYPLTGLHSAVACNKCHTTGYAGTPTDCKSCHLTNFNNAKLPDHIAAGITQDCAPCHTPAGWKPSAFNHSTTSFVLTGGHTAIVQCSACHKGNLTSASTTCYGCHQVQYTGAKNHVSNGYSTDCKSCHTTNNWQAISVNHALTNFPLTGKHTTTACAACHPTIYAGTPTACYSCHTANYNGTNHAASGFSTDCAPCHSTTAWTPSTFNHTTYFPISSGKHNGISCTECHTTAGNYKSFTCIVCHEHSNKTSIDSEHRKVSNYTYTGTSCYTCHPTGRN